MGAVEHPPSSTLDFPLSYDPQKYKHCHNFAAQVDEATIAAEGSPPAAAAAAGNQAAAVAAKQAPCEDPCHPATDTQQQDAKTVDLEQGTGGTCGQTYTYLQRMRHVTGTLGLDHVDGCNLPPPPRVPATSLVDLQSKAQLHKPRSRMHLILQCGRCSWPDQVMAAAMRRLTSAAAAGIAADAAGVPVKRKHSLRRSPTSIMDLDPLDPAVAVAPRLNVSDAVLRTMPLWLTVLLLLLTRIPALPIKKVLQRWVPEHGRGGACHFA